MRIQQPLGGLALAALIAVISGCGSTAPTSPAGNAATARSVTRGTPVATKQEKAVRFAECVRVHGVPHFPDPDTSGSFNFGVDVSEQVFASAVNACKALEPPGALSSKRSYEQQSAALRFAACVRANGVPDFPDPVNGQPVIDTYRIPSSNRPGGMSILNAATRRCNGVLGLHAGPAGGTGG
jgi:hypothetical protein